MTLLVFSFISSLIWAEEKNNNTDLISASVAVVGGGEDGDHVPVVGPVVPLHHQLMGPGQDRLSTGNTFVQKVKVSAGINDSIANSWAV